jgi:oligo-1,6-glucosidase
VVALGDFTMLLPHHEQVYAFTRRLGEVELLVVCNVSGDPVDLDLPNADAWGGTEVLLTNRPGHPAAADLTVLAPWEARVHRRIHHGATQNSVKKNRPAA